MSSNYVPYSEVYNEQQYGSRDRRPDRARVQEIAAEDIDAVRQQQLDTFYRPAPPRDDAVNRRRQRERSADDAQYGGSRRRRRPQQRDSRSSSDSDSEPQDRRQDQKTNKRRAQSERPPSRSRQPRRYDGDYQGLVARNLDSSPNGIAAAVVGAGVVYLGARRYGAAHFDPEKSGSHWKPILGAVAGGLAFNAAENKWKKMKEEKEGKDGGDAGT